MTVNESIIDLKTPIYFGSGGKLFILIISLVIFVFVCYNFFLLLRSRSRRKKFAMLDIEEIKSRWSEIYKRTIKGGEDALAVAVMEADSFFDALLAKKYSSSLPYSKRLGMLVAQYNDLEPIWYAHKIRNRLAHEGIAKVSLVSLRKAINYYEKVLKRIGLL